MCSLPDYTHTFIECSKALPNRYQWLFKVCFIAIIATLSFFVSTSIKRHFSLSDKDSFAERYRLSIALTRPAWASAGSHAAQSRSFKDKKVFQERYDSVSIPLQAL